MSEVVPLKTTTSVFEVLIVPRQEACMPSRKLCSPGDIPDSIITWPAYTTADTSLPEPRPSRMWPTAMQLAARAIRQHASQSEANGALMSCLQPCPALVGVCLVLSAPMLERSILRPSGNSFSLRFQFGLGLLRWNWSRQGILHGAGQGSGH